MTDATNLREWLFRGLMFEAEAELFRTAGIRVGADTTESERTLLAEVLDPFGVELRNQAQRMARLYALLYCFENSVRATIAARLEEQHGVGWWDECVPGKIRTFAESRKAAALKESWLEGDMQSLLGFVEFGHLADIITNNWEDFSDLLPTQHFLHQRFLELEKVRHFVAHHRLLLPGEFQRIEMYVADWNRQVGF